MVNGRLELLVGHECVELIREHSRVVKVSPTKHPRLLHRLKVAHVQLTQVDCLVAICSGHTGHHGESFGEGSGAHILAAGCVVD